jgi:hypothetical protein
MSTRRRYRSRPDRVVIAVQIDLDLSSFTYTKWGGEQRAKSGDWLVDNNGDVYTVDADVFARTYRNVGPGQYTKVTQVWASVASDSGTVETLEGSTAYVPGDYLVSNNEDGTDSYCITAGKFETLYELDE